MAPLQCSHANRCCTTPFIRRAKTNCSPPCSVCRKLLSSNNRRHTMSAVWCPISGSRRRLKCIHREHLIRHTQKSHRQKKCSGKSSVSSTNSQPITTTNSLAWLRLPIPCCCSYGLRCDIRWARERRKGERTVQQSAMRKDDESCCQTDRHHLAWLLSLCLLSACLCV